MKSHAAGFLVLATMPLILSCGQSAPIAEARARPGQAEIKVLSNRAALVSGGDALVEVVPGATRVKLNGEDITSAFAVRPNGRYIGLVTG
jgi:hypothetical protein